MSSKEQSRHTAPVKDSTFGVRLFLYGAGTTTGRRRVRWLIILACSLVMASVPSRARAECGTFDLATCVNAAQYAFWQGVASALWSINRVLLTLAYQLDVFRAWLVETVFTSVFQVVTDTISPALVPVATIAVLVGVLLFLLLPVIGRVDVVSIRRALVWIVVAPLLLGVAGQGLAGAEQIRTTVGQTMFAAAQEIGSTPQFGAASSEMNANASALYPFSGCGGSELARPFVDGGSASGIFMDDLAAAMMYADAEDIHCPMAGSGPGSDLPDGFYSPAEGGPASGGGDYATTQSVSDMPASESAEWMAKIQRGCTRLLMGIIPSFLAVMNAVIQLLFALALVLLFIALPLGLLLVFFTDTSAGVTGLARRMVTVLQTSWSSSLLLGIVFVALVAASALGNVAAFVGLSLAGLFLTFFVIMIAVNAFMSSVQAVAQTVGMTTGITGTVARTALAGAAGGAGAALGGGMQTLKTAGDMSLNYAVARRSGTSRRYALGTAAGQLGGVRRIGGLAAALGMQSEVTDGIYTGERGSRSREGLRLTQRLAASDATKKDAAGLTMREREQERDLQRQSDRARRGNVIDEATRLTEAGARLVRHPVATTRSVVTPPTERIMALSGDLAQAAWERARAAQDTVTERAGNDPTLGRSIVAVAGAASHGFRRDARSGRMAHDGRGGIRLLPRVPDAELPQGARHEPVAQIGAGRLLREGYHLQYNQDDTVTFWQPDSRQSVGASSFSNPNAHGGTDLTAAGTSTAPDATGIPNVVGAASPVLRRVRGTRRAPVTGTPGVVTPRRPHRRLPARPHAGRGTRK